MKGRVEHSRGSERLLKSHLSICFTLGLPRHPLVSRGDDGVEQVRQRLRAEVGNPKVEHHPARHLPLLEERWREVEALVTDAEPQRRLFRIEPGDLRGAGRFRPDRPRLRLCARSRLVCRCPRGSETDRAVHPRGSCRRRRAAAAAPRAPAV